MKLKSNASSFDHCIFADYYRFGRPDHEVPLVVYVGGATSRDEYKKRLQTEPLPIVSEFAQAFEVSGLPCADLLVLPFPPEPDGNTHQQLFSALIIDLLRQTGNPRPERIGCVGFSLGASFASYLTFSLVQVKALATLGGYGMIEGANESNMVGDVTSRMYRCWWNADSPGYMENLFFFQFLTNRDVEMEIETASGGHDFTDYAKNGSVTAAFKFVMAAF